MVVSPRWIQKYTVKNACFAIFNFFHTSIRWRWHQKELHSLAVYFNLLSVFVQFYIWSRPILFNTRPLGLKITLFQAMRLYGTKRTDTTYTSLPSDTVLPVSQSVWHWWWCSKLITKLLHRVMEFITILFSWLPLPRGKRRRDQCPPPREAVQHKNSKLEKNCAPSGCLQIQPNKFPGDFQDTLNKFPVDIFTLIEPP